VKIENDELINILSQYNSWWRNEPVSDLPTWKRAAFGELSEWINNPPAARAVMLSGARQIGKTTLLMQAISELLSKDIPAGNIIYITFDHPIIKLAGIEQVLKAWREREPKREGIEYIFLDEAQFMRDWGVWIKHQVDFFKNRRIIFTGSATPLLEQDQESGVGRWYTIKLTTLSFYEYLQIKKVNLPALPSIRSLKEIFAWKPTDFYKVTEIGANYIGYFHDYLLRGGFPQTALVSSINQAQKLLREDIIDKVLKRDMTALFGVRRILDLEHLFLYLCRNDGAILDMQALCSNLEIPKKTAQNFIELLESTHLIYRLKKFGYGKEVLRGKEKIYLADAAISPAVMLKGKSVLEDTQALGVAAEASVLKHLFSRYYSQNVNFSYWLEKNKCEVDLVAELANQLIPFEVKYRNQHTALQDLKGICRFCELKKADRGYVVTKSLDDFGIMHHDKENEYSLLKIPAALLCYWMGEMEVKHQKYPD
jgi:predicted AAA+ superfamily ATPase